MPADEGAWDVSPDRFEKMVADIERVLRPGATVTQDANMVDAAGIERQIDVLIEFAEEEGMHYHAIECRRRIDRPGIDWIDQVKGKYSDLDVVKVTAVSAVGFTDPAKIKAKAAGIDTLCLAETDASDWRIRLGCRNFKALAPAVELRPISIVLDCAGSRVPSAQLIRSACNVKCFELGDGKRVPLRDLCKGLWRANVIPELRPKLLGEEMSPRRESVVLKMTDELPVWLVVDGERFPVASIRIDAVYSITTSQTTLLGPWQYEDAESGAVKAGIVETAQPVSVSGRDFYVTLHHVPADHDSEDHAQLLLTERPASGEADTLPYPEVICANYAELAGDGEAQSI